MQVIGLNSWQVTIFGSNANNGANAGSFYWNLNNDSSNLNRNIGTHLADAHQKLKTVYCVDAYVEHLGKVPSRLVRQASYWYSMWSHRRNQAWKGYVQIDLASNDDALATAQLENLARQGAST